MFFHLSFLSLLLSCSEYQLAGPKNPIDITEEIEDPIADTADTQNDTDAADSGDLPVDESAPIAVCSVAPNPVTPPFTPAAFDGSGSYDPDGNPIVLHYWELVELPEGSAATLPYNSGIYISGFYADLAGEYVGQLTVTNDLGLTDTCRVSLEAIPAQNLWVELFWQHSGDDLDLHLLAPGGTLLSDLDCYYANCAWINLDWGIPGVAEDNPSLDIDDIPGTGPENINILAPQTDGVYTIYVHDYPGSVYSGTNDATVNVYLNGSLVWTDTKPITVEDSYTPYAIIDWATLTITPL
jgi:hypothetical protein